MRKMKDSGIEWIGKIPNDWKTLKVKYLATEPDSLFTDGDWINSDIITEEGVRYLTSGNVGEGYFKKQGDGYISQETFDQLHCLKALPNDLMICRLNLPIGRSCIIPNDEPFYVVAVDNVILRPNHDIDKKFIMYCMNTPGYAAEAEMAAGGTTMKRISRTDLGNLVVPIPSLEEQKAIADYLDGKCADIDQIRADIEKQIDILNDYKKSVITEAVTKGLNPKAKLKDSGIEWIGKIPEGWMIKRLGTLASSKPYSMVDGPFGSDMKNEEYVDEGIPIIQLTNIKPYYHNIETLKFITEEKHKQLIRHTAEAGDIAIAKMMPAGRACILSNKYHKYVVAADAIRFKVNESNDNRFILYGLNTYCMTECEIVSKGSTRIRISLEIARKLNLAVPPLSEQKAIADYLDEKCSEIDATIADKQKQLETLDEYKKSLIFEYVTGKKEVP